MFVKIMKGKVDKITIQLVTPMSLILFLVFFFAKIFDKIDWSWWWVFSPLWIPFVVYLVLIILVIIAKIVLWK